MPAPRVDDCQSPPPAHNFDAVPIVTHLDEFWHRKYGEDEDGRLVRIAATEDVAQQRRRRRASTCRRRRTGRSSLALGLPIIAYGLIFTLVAVA